MRTKISSSRGLPFPCLSSITEGIADLNSAFEEYIAYLPVRRGSASM
jgi:hypothetical protein